MSRLGKCFFRLSLCVSGVGGRCWGRWGRRVGDVLFCYIFRLIREFVVESFKKKRWEVFSSFYFFRGVGLAIRGGGV